LVVIICGCKLLPDSPEARFRLRYGLGRDTGELPIQDLAIILGEAGSQ